MTQYLQDILREADELSGILAFTTGEGRQALEAAAAILRDVQHIYITGIGSSWHAGMAVRAFFDRAARPVHLVDASELVHSYALPPNSAVLVLSRSGRSIEVVQALDLAARAGAKVIAVTNAPDSPLSARANAVLQLGARFDHNVSVTMYTGLALVGGLLAVACLNALTPELIQHIEAALRSTNAAIPRWRALIEESVWFEADAPTYFLARGAGLATCNECRLLWEEAAKAPATALTTGGFRHGPQEVVREGLRVGLWLHPDVLHQSDLVLARDLESHGAKVMVVGRDVPTDAATLVLSVPPVPPQWQFLTEIVPAQLAAERLARLRGADCDSFRLCPYVVESEGGLAA